MVDILQEHLRVPLLPRALFSFDQDCYPVVRKADAFVSHPAFVLQKRSGPAEIRNSSASGCPAHNPMLMESGVIDFELDASRDVICRLIVALLDCRILSDSDVSVFKGALATRKSLWLVALQFNQVTLEEMPWHANGSAARLSEFFVHENPAAKVLDRLLRDMKLRLIDRRCLLGSGEQPLRW